jgi:hypothetical protein
LEESDYTGAFERIGELRSQLATGEFELADQASEALGGQGPSHRKRSPTLDWEREDHPGIGWLAPIELNERGVGLDLDEGGRRPSRKGFLPISLLKYLEIAEWAGRCVRQNKRGIVPGGAPPIFARLGFDSQGFLESMLNFAKRDRYFKATERQGTPEMKFSIANSA